MSGKSIHGLLPVINASSKLKDDDKTKKKGENSHRSLHQSIHIQSQTKKTKNRIIPTIR